MYLTFQGFCSCIEAQKSYVHLRKTEQESSTLTMRYDENDDDDSCDSNIDNESDNNNNEW